MASFNPLRLLIIPFLSIVTIPLAIFAGLTTTFAFSVLLFRVMIVYLDVIISFVPSYIFGTLFSRRRLEYTMYSQVGSSHVSPASSPGRRRRRRLSTASGISVEAPNSGYEKGLGIAPSIGLVRDFEGVGGWRASGDDDDLWTNIHSRMELPDKHHQYYYGRPHHQRTLSAGLAPSTKEGLLLKRARTRSPGERRKVSPNSSKARTPPSLPPTFTSLEDEKGFFDSAASPKLARKL